MRLAAILYQLGSGGHSSVVGVCDRGEEEEWLGGAGKGPWWEASEHHVGKVTPWAVGLVEASGGGDGALERTKKDVVEVGGGGGREGGGWLWLSVLI